MSDGTIEGSLSMGTLADVTAEMRYAAEKHQDRYMSAIVGNEDHFGFLVSVFELGQRARYICETDPTPGPMAVLVEELGEVADELIRGHDPRRELVQSAAMSLAWLEGLRT